MSKKSPYQQANEDIAVIMAEAKTRQNIRDADIGKLIGLEAITIRNKRSTKTLPTLQFWKVLVLAEAAGYCVRFERKGGQAV